MSLLKGMVVACALSAPLVVAPVASGLAYAQDETGPITEEVTENVERTAAHYAAIRQEARDRIWQGAQATREDLRLLSGDDASDRALGVRALAGVGAADARADAAVNLVREQRNRSLRQLRRANAPVEAFTAVQEGAEASIALIRRAQVNAGAAIGAALDELTD
ncbi:MAG: hypothetical protein AAGB51_05240 [Planctomycetota bacterium]